MNNSDRFSQYDTSVIDYIQLTTRDGTVYDIRNMLVEMNIYTSIFQTTMEAGLTLADSMNIISNFPIVGGEKIEVRWRTAGKQTPNVASLRVARIGQRFFQENKSAFQLDLVSEVEWLNSVKRLSRGWEAAHSDIIRDCINDLGYELITDTPSAGITTFASPMWSPLSVAKWALGSARDRHMSPMLLWEDVDGMHLSSAHYLKGQAPAYKLYESPTGFETAGEKVLYNVRELEFGEAREVISQRYEGLGGYTEHMYDFFTKGYTRTKRTYDNFFNNVNQMDSGKIQLGKETTDDIHRPIFTRPDGRQMANSVRHFTDLSLRNNILRTTTIGDHESRVGAVIEFDVLSPQPLPDGQPRNERLIGGSHLVTGIRHILRPAMYLMVRELAKDSYNEKLEGVDND
ncbi:baseplate hub [Vibrio phage YC]|uniref:Baseplate hub n=1 Tax=Vibrio phage YC TaxID=2267403 RepID=A0A384ZS34_9CAUD|nr:tail protein [Vibrio phage YC]AXC34439.1 baseplate hub [Vibrio phage YC]